MAQNQNVAHIEELPIFCYYDQQRFKQFGSMDCANWYGIQVDSGKKKQALYPCMGRKHLTFLGENRLIFNEEPRAIYKTINYFYVVDGTAVYAVDRFFNRVQIGEVTLGTSLWFAFLPVNDVIYAILTDEHHAYVITETPGMVPTFGVITDTNLPVDPIFVASFGNRFVISSKNTPNFGLSRINLFSTAPDAGTLANCFTINGSALFARASGVIGQMTVLHTQLYILCNYTTDIWANISTQINVAGVITEFPWKLNSSYNWDYGIADPDSLDTDFGRMVWLAQNANGLVAFMSSNGQQPEPISSQAINVILENSAQQSGLSPFIEDIADGFLYQYENTIFYRVSAGIYKDYGVLDVTQNVSNANSIEYNFETGKWGRVIELNGERNRIQRHVYFANKHLVTVQGDPAIYEMAGNIYYNELRNTMQANSQAADAFSRYPFRYELVTQQIFLEDYSEFVDDYIEIDFVFGNQTPVKSDAPFPNTVFIVDETSDPESPLFLLSEDGRFIIQQGTNTGTGVDEIYNLYLNPHLELYYSDDGGETFLSADLREFSQLGQYRWRMRWYELASSRNRCYKLVGVSASPIVILGGVRNTMRISGGAN